MGKGSKSGASHQVFKDRAKNRVDDLQGMVSDLQSARRESRNIDVNLLEEQLHQLLREWKAELNEPSPASSLQQGGSQLLSSDIYRLLQLCDEEDDATSVLAAPKPDPDGQKIPVDISGFHEGFTESNVAQEQVNNMSHPNMGLPNMGLPNMGHGPQMDYNQFNPHQEFDPQYCIGFDSTNLIGEDVYGPQIPDYAKNICPPPAAFLGPKCALWDCTRPAQGWCENSRDYCSEFHEDLAPNEGYPGMAPVLRPGGIGLKDSLLFAALSAKAHGKEVGVPECEGAATTKSPWNARELFDLTVLEHESIREWLFFDKPRRAFETGSRKQRSLPDYNGRGWHESRKQVMNEYGGLKRSYYMDPQPKDIIPNFEWHLFEYEITKYDACALYRLELKRVEPKNSPKGKVVATTNNNNDSVSVAALQKQMVMTKLTPEDNKRGGKGKGRGKASATVAVAAAANQMMTPGNGEFDFVGGGMPIDYHLIEDIDGYYI